MLAYKIAAICGQPNVDTMLAGMESRHLTEWAAFLELDPQGEVRHDFRFARLMALIANMFGKANISPAKFMPEFGVKKPPVDNRPAMRAKLIAMAEATEKRKKLCP